MNQEVRENLTNDVPVTTLFRYLCSDYKALKKENSELRSKFNNLSRMHESTLKKNENLQIQFETTQKENCLAMRVLRKENRKMKNAIKSLFSIMEYFKSLQNNTEANLETKPIIETDREINH